MITREVTDPFPMLDTLEYGFPYRGWDLPARLRYGLRVARQRHKQRLHGQMRTDLLEV